MGALANYIVVRVFYTLSTELPPVATIEYATLLPASANMACLPQHCQKFAAVARRADKLQERRVCSRTALVAFTSTTIGPEHEKRDYSDRS